MSTVVCVQDIFPTVSSLIEAVRSMMPSTPIDFPGFNLTLPGMPSMPSIPWEDIININALIEMFANQLANSQIVAIISVVYDTLSSLVSLPFPSMPGLPDFDFGDILSGDASAIVDAVKNMFPDIGLPDFSGINLPGVPWPIFPSISCPVVEILTAVQLTIGNYMSIMCNTLFEMVNMVADLLKLPAMPAIPSIPSVSSIMAMLPDVPSLDDLKALVFGAFGGLSISLPSPLIPGFSCPEFEFIEGLKALYSEMSNYCLSLITEFVTSILGLALSLPKICFPISIL